MKIKFLRFILFPPHWLERILEKSERYKIWAIREADKVLADASRGGGEE